MRQELTAGPLVVVIGGGPGGLTAAHELTQYNRRVIVLEKEDKVGGLARTENYRGFYFDLGGHRFFTKVNAVKQLWHQILGEDFLHRPRLSRIYYNTHFFSYPLQFLNALRGLGFVEGVRIVLSYLRWQLLPYQCEATLEAYDDARVL